LLISCDKDNSIGSDLVDNNNFGLINMNFKLLHNQAGGAVESNNYQLTLWVYTKMNRLVHQLQFRYSNQFRDL
jgi:hypothetical protein